MVDQLLPDVGLHVAHIQLHQLLLLHGFGNGEAGQVGDAVLAFLQQADDEVGTTQLQHGGDIQGAFGQLLIEEAAVAHALFCEDEGLVGKVMDGKRRFACEGGAGIGHEAHVHMLLLGDDIVLLVHVVIQGDDGIGLVAVEHGKHHIGIGIGEFQIDAGVLAVEVQEVVEHHVLAHRVRGHEADQATGRVGCAHILHEFIGEGVDAVGIAQQLLALVGEGNGMVDALEQQAVQLRFQLLDLKGHGGLGIAQRIRRPGEAVHFCHVHKGDEIADLHMVGSSIENIDDIY